MNKESKFIAVLVVIFIFSIQLLVFESYQSLFSSSDKNENNYFTISTKEDNDKDDDEDDNNDNVGFDFETCKKILDSETCKKIGDSEIILSTNQLTKEEIQAEEITRKYLEPADPNQKTIDILGQMQNKILESDMSQNQGSLTPYTTPTTPSVTTPGPSSSTPLLSLENLNTLDQNQLIDAISSKISQLRTFEKNKITQALFDLTQGTAAKGGDVMNSLRQIGTKILQNPSDPLIDKIIGLAQTK